ncbi:MAG: chalcone isomerase family protein [Pseudomonas fluorescens]|nr:chalcone isomerase family protein [Pseudomonas fluorescens]
MQLSRVFAIAALLVAPYALAGTVDVAGVKMEDSMTIYNNTLLLNGAGVVSNGKTQLYVVKIYSKKKFANVDQLFQTPGPKRLVITAGAKEFDTAPIMKLFNRNVEAQADKSDMAKLVPGLMSLGKIFGTYKVIKPGESLIFDWAPYAGLVMYMDSKLLGEPLKEPEFFKAAMSIWMGDTPLEPKLRDALLGKD